MNDRELTLDLIDEAALFLRGRVHETPAELSAPLSDKRGVEVYLKLENLQITGSFKVRVPCLPFIHFAEKESRGLPPVRQATTGKAWPMRPKNSVCRPQYSFQAA